MSVQLGAVIPVENPPAQETLVSKHELKSSLSNLGVARRFVCDLRERDRGRLAQVTDELFQDLLRLPNLSSKDTKILNHALQLGLLGLCDPKNQQVWIYHAAVKNFFERPQKKPSVPILGSARATFIMAGYIGRKLMREEG